MNTRACRFLNTALAVIVFWILFATDRYRRVEVAPGSIGGAWTIVRLIRTKGVSAPSLSWVSNLPYERRCQPTNDEQTLSGQHIELTSALTDRSKKDRVTSEDRVDIRGRNYRRDERGRRSHSWGSKALQDWSLTV